MKSLDSAEIARLTSQEYRDDQGIKWLRDLYPVLVHDEEHLFRAQGYRDAEIRSHLIYLAKCSPATLHALAHCTAVNTPDHRCVNCGGSGRCYPCGGRGAIGYQDEEVCQECTGTGVCVVCAGTGEDRPVAGAPDAGATPEGGG